MKNFTFFLCLLLGISAPGMAQSGADSTGMPGDSFSLEGALTLFSEAPSPEDFEKELNREENQVNNLDINQDGEVDYLRVEDISEGEGHALVIQALVSADDVQDVAVILIEKDGENSAIAQIVGDEEVYGEEEIFEYSDETLKGGKGGPEPFTISSRIVFNVWIWPCVRFMYLPAYRPWVSPYRWSYYPVWWKPFRFKPWRMHWNYCAKYRVHTVHCPYKRSAYVYQHYHGHRKVSVHVHQHYAPAKAARMKQNKTGNNKKPAHKQDGKVSGKQNGGPKSAPNAPKQQGSKEKGPGKSGNGGQKGGQKRMK